MRCQRQETNGSCDLRAYSRHLAQVWPKKSGHMREKTVESMEEFAAKVSAARAAIGDADFFLIARTDARGTSAKHGLPDAITRANLYVSAGADAALVEGPRSTYELQTIAANTQVCGHGSAGSEEGQEAKSRRGGDDERPSDHVELGGRVPCRAGARV